MAVACAGVAFGQQADLPNVATAGECFARVLIQETTEVVTEQVVEVEPAREEKIVDPSSVRNQHRASLRA